jgi:L-rhamnose isomerase
MGTIEQSYTLAKEAYELLGIDTDKALDTLQSVSLSMHCWQGDDVGGFEDESGTAGGGIMATGNYPGRARNADELRSDADKAMSLIPGKHRFNLHAMYAETDGQKVDRDALESKYFSRWIDWAKEKGIGLDFNGTYFGHPNADSGFTLSSLDESVRAFWVRHGKACRHIAAAMGKALGNPSVNNIWIPDGYKDIPADRKAPREQLLKSLDEILSESIDKQQCLDTVESKLFGIGSESYVTGSHEFYMGYALKNNLMLCIDAGHFHPTEQIADKISALFCFLDRLLLHVSRGVRWDSDHVVILSDDLRYAMKELVRGDYLSRVAIATDFFDASINRVAAWVIGVRSVQKALLEALLEPSSQLRKFEYEDDYTSRLALMEEVKTYPLGAVWDYYCLRNNVPVGLTWLEEVKKYENAVLIQR